MGSHRDQARLPGAPGAQLCTHIYRDLTMQEDHRLMKNRADMNGVTGGLHNEQVLLAAFLEATDKIDWRALQKRVPIGEIPEPINPIGEMPEPINMDAHQQTSIMSESRVTPFAFQRANLVRAPK
jgi:hypothetical protein